MDRVPATHAANAPLTQLRTYAAGAGKAISISFANQAVSSGTNFFLGLFFVRYLDVAAFGIYGVGLAAVFLFAGVGNALFLTQMVVNFEDKLPTDRAQYAGRILVLIFGFSLLSLALAAGAFLTVFFTMPELVTQWDPFVAVAVAAVAYLLKDYFSRVAYSRRRETDVLFINVALVALTAAALLAVWISGLDLTVGVALWIYAGGQLGGAIVGFAIARPPLFSHRVEALRGDLREALEGGRWALGGVLVTWLQSQAYVYVTLLFAGPVGVAYANAARIFVSPFQLVMPALNQVTMPRLTVLRSSGSRRVARMGGMVTAAVLAGSMLYFCALYFVYPVAAQLVLKGKYQGVGVLVFAWCAVLLMQLARDGASTILQTLKQFKKLTIASSWAAGVSVTATILLARGFGAPGAVVALAVGECILAITLWLWIRRNARE